MNQLRDHPSLMVGDSLVVLSVAIQTVALCKVTEPNSSIALLGVVGWVVSVVAAIYVLTLPSTGSTLEPGLRFVLAAIAVFCIAMLSAILAAFVADFRTISGVDRFVVCAIASAGFMSGAGLIRGMMRSSRGKRFPAKQLA